MTQAELKVAIESAFADTPAPGDSFEDISTTQWDEGIVEYFKGTTWRGHRVRDLRHHVVALSFFTDKAFRYWLPAFMLAELEDPEGEADVIAECIASSFRRSNTRLEKFSAAELEGIAGFLTHCAQSYSHPALPDRFSEAAEVVRTRLVALTRQ